MSNDKHNPRLAVLIDADNTFKVVDLIDELFEEISKFGDASVRRIYGDWTKENMKRWKEVLPKHAIQPIQQYANTTGKNATDSALIIDAMDLLYQAPLDGFCIVSSDSDFTRLAVRFRESGKQVYGFGEKKPPTRSLQPATSSYTSRFLRRKSPPPSHQQSQQTGRVAPCQPIQPCMTKPPKPK